MLSPLFSVAVALVTFSFVRLFVTPWTVAHQVPLLWNSPGKNTGVGSHSLLQGIFATQGSNLVLLHCRWCPVLQGDSSPPEPPKKENYYWIA